MNEQDQKTADQIIDAVSAAVVAASPLAGALAPEVLMGVAALRAVLSLMKQLGHGDAVREALDAELAAGRQVNDAALATKHRAAARTLRAAVVPPALLSPDLAAAIAMLADHHDPQP